MDVLKNWDTFFKLWIYFTFFDIIIFLMIANFYINGYLKYKQKLRKNKNKHKHVNKA